MLQNLHVKNLALIDETEVEFGPGLNILSGETGAGKSIIIGSINLALGAKANKILQKDALSLDYADPETVARNFLYFHKYSLPVTTDKLGKRRLCLTKNGNIDYRKLTLKGFLLDE